MPTIYEWKNADGTQPYGKSYPFPNPGTLGTAPATCTPFNATYLAAVRIPPFGELLTDAGNGTNSSTGLLDSVPDSVFSSSYSGSHVANAITGILRDAYTVDDQTFNRAAQILTPSHEFQPTINFIPYNPGGTCSVYIGGTPTNVNFGTAGSLVNLITAIDTAIGSLTGQAAIQAALSAWSIIMPTMADLQALMGKTYGCTNLLTIFTAINGVNNLFGSSQVIDFNKPAATHTDSSFYDAISIVQNGTLTGGVPGDYRVRVRFNALALLGA